jgi:hypothetical protein
LLIFFLFSHTKPSFCPLFVGSQNPRLPFLLILRSLVQILANPFASPSSKQLNKSKNSLFVCLPEDYKYSVNKTKYELLYRKLQRKRVYFINRQSSPSLDTSMKSLILSEKNSLNKYQFENTKSKKFT